MASIAVASMELQGASAFIAHAVAAWVDNEIIMPALFPPDPVEGARIGEIGIMGADKGDPVGNVYGTYAKVAGQLIWAKDLIEKSVSEQTGKGGRRITYRYYADCAVAIARTKTGSLASIDAVLADEIPIYTSEDLNVLATIEENGLGMYMEPIYDGSSTGKGMDISHYEPWIICDTTVNADAKTNVYDQLEVGDKINLSDWTQSANNDSNDKITEKKRLTLRGSFISSGKEYFYEYQYYALKLENFNKVQEVATATETQTGTQSDHPYGTASGSVSVIHGTTTTISIDKLAGVGWKSGVQESGNPTIHLGNNGSVDSVISAIEGSANTPKFKDVAYVSFNNLNLKDYGQRIPNFEFIVSNTAQSNARTCLEDILQDSELQSTEYDVSGVDTTEIVGYTTMGISETVKKIQPIALAFDIRAQEKGGVIYFFTHKSSNTTTTLIDDYVGVYTSNKPSGKVAINQAPIDEKYGEVSLTYVDSQNENKFTQGLERAMAYSQSDVANRATPHRWTKLNVNLPITMTPDSAREIVHRLLWSSWSDDLIFEFTLPSRYLALQENDRIVVSAGGKDYTAVISKADIGANYMMKIEAQLDVAVEQDFSGWTK